MIEFLKEHWTIISSVGSFTITFIVILLSTKFAKREEMELIKNDVSSLKGEMRSVQNRIEQLPTQKELNALSIELVRLGGEIKAIKPELKGIKNIGQLLLENEMKGKK